MPFFLPQIQNAPLAEQKTTKTLAYILASKFKQKISLHSRLTYLNIVKRKVIFSHLKIDHSNIMQFTTELKEKKKRVFVFGYLIIQTHNPL